MTYQYATYEKKGHIAYVTLNRPEVMNSLHLAAHFELGEIFADFKSDDESWVAILTGAGDRAFSAGNDLKATAEAVARGEKAPEPYPAFGGITRNFECAKPLIAAVNGVAYGGGCEMALACDIIVAAEHAHFGLPETRVGLLACFGGIHRLARQIPLKIAMGLMLTGKPITAREAQLLGLVNEVVSQAELMATAERWANEIVECAPISVRITKENVLRGLTLTVDEAIDRDMQSLKYLRATEDFREGPRAFAEKRKPQWKGR